MQSGFKDYCMNPLIVIPTYNESGNISNIIEKIDEILQNIKYSVLIVDDSSIDGTKEEITELQKKYNNLLLLERDSKRGLASAYVDGFKYGAKLGFEHFIQMDADFSHNPKYLTTMIEKMHDNDVVIASRNVKGGGVQGWSVFRNLISKGGSLYSRIILGMKISDLTGGFNGWNIETLKKINLDSLISKGYAFQIEMKYKAAKNRAKITEFPIVFEDRKFGKSKMSKEIFFEALFNVIKIRFGCNEK